MPKTRSSETRIASSDRRRRGLADTSRVGRRRNGAYGREDDVLYQDVVQEWIRDHQDAALLAAFAVGVFMGAWMRG